MDKINYFADRNFFDSAEKLFKDLNIPLKSIDNQPYRPEDFLTNTYNPDSSSHSLVDKAYLLGIVDDDAFANKSQYDSLEKIAGITTDYEGLAVVGIELKTRENNLLPTRSQLAEITRAVNREFLYTPVTVLFKYGEFLALANAERTSFLVKYKEGEKVGKVSLLRDVNFTNPHTGHLQILRDLRRPDKIQTFTDLYKHWADVFNVNVLNKKFYQELSNWYFWAIQNVTFPGQPTLDDALLHGKDFKDLKQQHNATNVIRMLTRLLFVWFMKEKKLIPDELFELQNLQSDILNEIAPFHEVGLYTESNKDSVYYKAILQNLFFATLNCPINADSSDKRQRGFRGEGYGTHRGIDWMMRYKNYFKDPDAFLQKMNNTVPFLNGGLFECLDNKDLNIYVDGFSDQMTKGEKLIVPDYLFFGIEEAADLSDVIGIADKKTKNSAVKGLINILKSYKFTIAENTPVEEEVALDPELLGKVFENLLASYNPETKTTARKQTGSFYTPREIVNYMVDESLIAYLKNKIQSVESDKEIDHQLHQLVTYSSENPFAEDPKTTREILKYMDECTILDPACGSGAFPMGVLQKMVHILDKLDPDNKIWKEVQIDKAKKESDEAFEIADKKAREDRLIEINEAFDQDINNPDYARKLFLIENCIYGVDIQPIATQISKLRFFISLVVEQHVDRSKDNFGIRPLPNLETKFVAANTLFGIKKEENLFSAKSVLELEGQLKFVRAKLFNAKTKDTKIKYRDLDRKLREDIAHKLLDDNFPIESAHKLASWDPFDQNTSSPFFDAEWMFDIKDGFDIVIGNPPYIGEKGNEQIFHILIGSPLFNNFYTRWMDYFYYFFHFGLDNLKIDGILSFITTNYYFTSTGGIKLRADLKKRSRFHSIVDFNELKIFESARGQHNAITILQKGKKNIFSKNIVCTTNSTIRESQLRLILNGNDKLTFHSKIHNANIFDGSDFQIRVSGINGENQLDKILELISKQSSNTLGEKYKVTMGVVTLSDTFSGKHAKEYPQIKAKKGDGIFVITNDELTSLNLSDVTKEKIIKPFYKNSDIYKYKTKTINELWLIYLKDEGKPIILERNLLTHFEKYGELLKKLKLNFLKNDIAAAVVKKWLHNGNYFVLFTPKKEEYFITEKIVFPYRSKSNIFSYSEVDFFGSKDIGYILKKDGNYNLKYLLTVLNSKLIFVWLYNRGKRKGETLELYTKPIQDIPIVLPSKIIENTLIILSDILSILSQSGSEKMSFFLNIIDGIVFELYFTEHMLKNEIDISAFVEKDLVYALGANTYDLKKIKNKEIIIEQLFKLWSEPSNEVAKRISQFKEKSPEILKVILES